MPRNFTLAILVFITCVLLLAGGAVSFAQNDDITGHPVNKSEDFTPRGLGTLPILHEGRFKPIDSFARYEYNLFSNQEDGAIFWLAESLFNPAYAEKLPVLFIRSGEIRRMLNLPVRDHKRYSFNEISAALRSKQDIIRSILNEPQENWSPAQADLITLHQNASAYGDILSSLTLFLPLNVQLPSDIAPALRPLAERPITYADVKPLEGFLRSYLENIIGEKEDDVTQYNEAEQAATFLSYSLAKISIAGKSSQLFAVIPNYAAAPDAGAADRDKSNNTETPWHTPWQAIDSPTLLSAASQHQPDFLHFWQELAVAYHRADQYRWDSAIEKLNEAYGQVDFPAAYRPAAITAERLYNAINPYMISCLLYALALGLFAASFIKADPRLPKAALITLAAGMVPHLIGVITRIYILQRPPVTTLYESVLFVGLVCVAYGLWLAMRRKDRVWTGLTALAGILIHILGFSHLQDGDSFLMLPAVLNTNFWLATHVIVITMGYAFCLLASLLAHYYLFIAPQRQGNHKQPSMRGMQHLALLSLLFAATGTILGGIWADQSWGRFWGWDPKENGALLIVLWLVWIIHGRLGGQISSLTYLAGMAYLSVIVALSWFGVNMLSVGLHSYGFTDQAAIALGGIVVIESLLVGGLYLRARGVGARLKKA